jgi:RHS repeat-associated protein
LVKDAGTGTTLASFQYEAFGRRVQNAAGDGVLYDGVNAIQELSGTTPVVNRLTGGLDEFFARSDASGTTFPLTDALGSTIALTDATGNIQTQYTYEPFGGTTPSGTPSANWYQYTGRENDGTGLYYYRARYYSPRFQRFISEDPIGFNGGINEFVYALDSPTNYSDPGGTQFGEGAAAAAAAPCLANPLVCGAVLGIGGLIVTEPYWGPAVSNLALQAMSAVDNAANAETTTTTAAGSDMAGRKPPDPCEEYHRRRDEARR